MKARHLVTLTAALVAGLVEAPSAQAQEVTLKVHHFTPSTAYIQTQLLEPWCAKLAKESKDRIKCRIYPSMQLGGTPAQLADQARDGIADIIFTNPSYQTGPFIKSEVFTLPFIAKNPVTASRAMWDFSQQHAADEYQRLKPLMVFYGDRTALHWAKKSNPTLEDVKGLRVRSPGRWEAKILTSLGMLPVQMPAPQITESVSKGVIDGVLVPWSGFTLLKLGDVTKYHTDVAPGQLNMNYPILLVAMNQAKYDSLPADLKKAVDAVSGREMSAWAGQVYADSMATGLKAGRDAGAVVSPLTDAEHARWVKATAGIHDEWIAEVNAKGADGKKLLEAAKTLINQYDK
jgi:TRAP-type C4-dicarboxylate transport system substrate-binding protein